MITKLTCNTPSRLALIHAPKINRRPRANAKQMKPLVYSRILKCREKLHRNAFSPEGILLKNSENFVTSPVAIMPMVSLFSGLAPLAGNTQKAQQVQVTVIEKEGFPNKINFPIQVQPTPGGVLSANADEMSVFTSQLSKQGKVNRHSHQSHRHIIISGNYLFNHQLLTIS